MSKLNLEHLYTHTLVFSRHGKEFRISIIAHSMEQARKIGESMQRRNKATLQRIEGVY